MMCPELPSLWTSASAGCMLPREIVDHWLVSLMKLPVLYGWLSTVMSELFEPTCQIFAT